MPGGRPGLSIETEARGPDRCHQVPSDSAWEAGSKQAGGAGKAGDGRHSRPGAERTPAALMPRPCSRQGPAGAGSRLYVLRTKPGEGAGLCRFLPEREATCPTVG